MPSIRNPNAKNRMKQSNYFKNAVTVAFLQIITCFFIVYRADAEIEDVITS